MDLLQLGSLYQLAFVVDDLDQAIDRWVVGGAGPFWLFPEFSFAKVDHPGGRSPVFDIAMGYSGDLLIELMQIRSDPIGLFPSDNLPQPHHIARLTTDIDRDLDALGADVLLRGTFPTGTPGAYADTRETFGLITEFVTLDEAVGGMLETIYEGSRDWNGNEPRRSF